MSLTVMPQKTEILPLREAASRFSTALWNDSADPDELTRSIAFGAVGCTQTLRAEPLLTEKQCLSARERGRLPARP